MKIYVCIKQVPDTETKIKINSDLNSIDTSTIKWVVNPYDEFAIEEAIKMKETNPGSTVTVFTVGPKKRVGEALRTALAMGADEGIIIDAPENLDTFQTAKALASAINKEGAFDLILTGKVAIDDSAQSVSQMLAQFLNVPHATVISKITKESGSYIVTRDVDGGAKEIIQITGTPVLAANKGLNMPRYASLPGIMKAKKKVLKEYDVTSLGVDTNGIKIKYSSYRLPAEKPNVKILAGDTSTRCTELVKLLRDEAKAL
jgi:electron transfer flavoprotein beta subunit